MKYDLSSLYETVCTESIFNGPKVSIDTILKDKRFTPKERTIIKNFFKKDKTNRKSFLWKIGTGAAIGGIAGTVLGGPFAPISGPASALAGAGLGTLAHMATKPEHISDEEWNLIFKKFGRIANEYDPDEGYPVMEATVNQVNQLAGTQNYHARLANSDNKTNLQKLQHAAKAQQANNERLNKINKI